VPRVAMIACEEIEVVALEPLELLPLPPPQLLKLKLKHLTQRSEAAMHISDPCKRMEALLDIAVEHTALASQLLDQAADVAPEAKEALLYSDIW